MAERIAWCPLPERRARDRIRGLLFRHDPFPQAFSADGPELGRTAFSSSALF